MTNSEIGLELKEKLDKAKIQFMMKASVFLSTVAFSLKHIIEDSPIPTAHTDGFKVSYNPNFIEPLSMEQLVGLIAHEVWHVAFNHIGRLGDKEAKYYMAAADYVINIMLVDGGFELPEGGLLDNRFRGMSTEQVYEILIEEQPPLPDEPMDHVLVPDGSGEEGESAMSELVEKNIREILIKATNQAAISGADPGSIPGEIMREVKQLTDPVLPWQTLLMRFLTEHQKNDYSWKRPNRKYMPMIMPSAYSEALQHIVIAVDTSGSITDSVVQSILTEIKYIHESLKPEKLTIIDCDYFIHQVIEIDQFSQIEDIKFTGGGGTSFYPVFEWCKENPTTALVYFTDLWAEPITEEPGYPVLWICYSDHEEAQIGNTIYTNYYERKAA